MSIGISVAGFCGIGTVLAAQNNTTTSPDDSFERLYEKPLSRDWISLFGEIQSLGGLAECLSNHPSDKGEKCR